MSKLPKIDQNDYDPKTLAWKLLVDDDVKQFKGEIMLCNTDDPKTRDNKFVFETLILLFCHMLSHYKIIRELENITPEEFDKIETVFVDAFQKINFHCFISKLDEIPNHYCRIVLKQEDNIFFELHPKITEEFHILINGSFNDDRLMKFQDIYSKLQIGNSQYGIHFDKIIH
jgi:hypothetical protein